MGSLAAGPLLSLLLNHRTVRFQALCEWPKRAVFFGVKPDMRLSRRTSLKLNHALVTTQEVSGIKMNRRLRKVRTALVLGVVLGASSCVSSPHSSPAVSAKVTQAQGCEKLPPGGKATMVIFDPTSGQMMTCDETRAQTRFVPASTFKIAHTLIALETGAISGVDEEFEWDGRDRGLSAWNRDLDVDDAVSVSAVWVFQAIAVRIGVQQEAEWVQNLEYGNETIGSVSDLRHFWLSGPLKISAIEQVDFLYRLHTNQLPVSPASIEGTLKALTLGRTQEGFRVYGKTGAMLPIDDEGYLRSESLDLLPSNQERTGWFVGWIDRPGQNGGSVYFAINLDLASPDAMAARTRLAYEVLRANGIAVPD